MIPEQNTKYKVQHLKQVNKDIHVHLVILYTHTYLMLFDLLHHPYVQLEKLSLGGPASKINDKWKLCSLQHYWKHLVLMRDERNKCAVTMVTTTCTACKA